jgi:hypothetical protein
LAVTLLFVEKIHQSAALFRFGLRISSNILLTSRNPKAIVDSPAFLEHGSVKKKRAVCGHTTRDPNKEDD